MTRPIPMVVIALLAVTLAAQEGESPADSTAATPAPASPAPATEAPARPKAKRTRPPAFYKAPDISAVWEGARRRVTGQRSAGLTEDFVLELLDSLAQVIQGDFEELARRAKVLESSKAGYIQKFYSSPISRDEVLGTAITAREAALQPHFSALYDSQGDLLRVRYVEPRRWLDQQERLAVGSGQRPPETSPFVRYFEQFDLRRLKGKNYVKKEKMEEGVGYYRLIFDQQEQIRTVQQFDDRGEQLFNLSFGRPGQSQMYATLTFPTDQPFSLFSLHPFLFLQEKSLVKPDWQVAVTRNDEGNLASLQVFNELDQLLYFYTYDLTYDPKKRTRTARGSLLLPDETVEGIFTIEYDRKDQPVRRTFYDAAGEIQQTIAYQYFPKIEQLVVITRDPYGIIISQQNVDRPRAGK